MKARRLAHFEPYLDQQIQELIKTINNNLGQFLNSKVANGYQKFPGELIIQWGLVGNTAGGSASNSGFVVFPIAFPNALLFVGPIVSEEIDGMGATSVRTTSANNAGFSWTSWVGGTLSGADGIRWFAIGC